MTARPRTGALRRLLAGGAVVLAVLGTDACAATDDPPIGDNPSQPAEKARIGLTEWTILSSADNLRPGEVTLVVTNTGATEHDLVVDGAEGTWHTPALDPGARSTLTIDTRAGETLRLWCDEPGHEAQGMHTTLSVDTNG